LVLDNVEHLLDAAPFVAECLIAPGVTILATSRAPLHLRGEREIAVAPLALPRRKPPPTADQLSQYAAVRLFIDRAQSVRADFVVDAANAPAVAEICHRLDGLSLAIELAAARVKMLPPHAMLGRLEQRLPMLTGGARDLPARQQTLRATIAWSYDLLTEDERRLYRRLSVFAGGWTIEAAEAVAGSPATGELGLDVFDALGRLLDHSLVHSMEGERAAEPRFGMLETIREFGLAQLAASGEADEARDRHAAHLAEFTEQFDAVMRGPELPKLLATLETEHDNLRAALAWTADRDPATMARIAGAAAEFWITRGYWTDARTWLGRTLAAGDAVAPAVRLKALRHAVYLARHDEDPAGAAALGHEALTLAREVQDGEAELRALYALASVALDALDYPRAKALAEESESLARDRGDVRRAAHALALLGRAAYMQDDPRRGGALLERARAEMLAAGDEWAALDLLGEIGGVAGMLGDLETARELMEEALVGLRAIDARYALAGTLGPLAKVVFQLGDLDGATALLQETLDIARALGSPSWTHWSEAVLGEIALAQGDLPRARALLESGLAGTRAAADPFTASCVLSTLGDLALAEGDPAAAASRYREAIDTAWGTGHRFTTATWLRSLAALLVHLDQHQLAARLFGAAEAVGSAAGVSFRGMDTYSREPELASLREPMGEPAFQSAFDAGMALPLETAVAEARALAEATAVSNGRAMPASKAD